MTESAGDGIAQVYAGIETWNSEGFDAFAEERWSPDIVWEEPSGFPDAGVRHGREACMQRMRERFEVLGHVEAEIVNATELSDRVVLTELIIRGRGQASGAPTEMRDWFVSEVDDDYKAVRLREFLTRDEAVRAAEELAARPTHPGR
jgi:ketosteroid isomerase-like protein